MRSRFDLLKPSSKGRHHLMKCANTCTIMRRRSFTLLTLSTHTTMHNTPDPSPPAVVLRHAQATTCILHVGLTHQRWAAHRTRLAWRTLLSLHAGAAPASFLRGLLFSSSTPPEHPARTPSSRAGTACRRRQGSTCSGPRLCAAARAGCASGRGWWCRTSGTCNVPQSLHSAPRCR